MEFNLTDLSWDEIESLDKEKLVVFLGIAPVEEHGKHLPIGVDIFETKAWIDIAIQRLNETLPEYCFAKLPIIPLGFADMGFFPGNIHVSRKLIFEIVQSIVKSISDWGVKNIVVISGHADPRHAIAIEQACETVNEENGVVAIAPMGSIFNCEQKGICYEKSAAVEEKLRLFPNDFHAGWIETSNMLDIAPKLVKPTYRQRPDVAASAVDMMDADKIASMIKGEGHIGFPKEADEDLGRSLNEGAGNSIKEAVLRFVMRSDYEQYMKHPLHEIPGMKIVR